jgi:hypothetical protein
MTRHEGRGDESPSPARERVGVRVNRRLVEEAA